MTRVDFYVASDEAARVACRLAEKAWKLGHKVYVHASDPTEAQKLDELRWTFRDVVGGDAAAKANARERFRFYRDRGYELETHQV